MERDRDRFEEAYQVATQARLACIGNARKLLRAADALDRDGELRGIAYHLGTLALEEIGKAGMVVAKVVGRSERGDSWFNKRLDDHEAKLMWALWTPMMRSSGVSSKEIERCRELAKSIHSQRLQGMYVSFDGQSDPIDPNLAIDPIQLSNLLDLVRARLEIEESVDLRADLATDESAHWFMEAIADREMLKYIMGNSSLEYLNNNRGDVRAWISWLRGHFDNADREAKAAIAAELIRSAPTGEAAEVPKWKVQIKIVTSSHSIRPKVLRYWNEQTDWIQLKPVANDKFAVMLEITLRSTVAVTALWSMAWGIARIFVISMNIATIGFFWWYKPTQTSRFYDKIVDLERNNFEVVLERSASLEGKHPNQTLSETDLRRLARCFHLLTALGDEVGEQLFGPYLRGITFLSKTDIHFSFVADACADFGRSLWACMSHFLHWDGMEESRSKAFHDSFEQPIRTLDDRNELCELLMGVTRRKADQSKLTVEDALKLKLLCDIYLITRSDEAADLLPDSERSGYR